MFSIIIPACQEENYIEKTLSSLPARKDVEVIVVCNGCTDKTAEKAKKYASILQLKERNVSKARNEGAQNAKGNILIFLDADTELTKGCLEAIEKTLQKHAAGTCKVLPDNKKIKYKISMAFKNLFLWTKWTSGIIFCTKEVFEKVNGFNEKLSKREDKEFVRKCAKEGSFGVASCYVINSMRRFEQKGMLRMMGFWIKEAMHPSKEKYEVIR